MPGRFARLIALALAVGIATGCGGADGPQDMPAERRDVRAAIERSFLSKSPANECAAYTGRLVREIYGSAERCRLSARPSALEPDDVDVGRIAFGDDRARAQVRLEGNRLDGLEGSVGLREADDGWLVDELGVDLLRTTLVTALRGPSFAGEPVLRSDATRRCVAGDLGQRPGPRVRSIAYDWMRAGEESGKAFIEQVLRPCLVRQREGRALLRREFEAGVAQAGRRLGQDAAERRCVVRRLRRTLSSRLIAEDAIRVSESVTPAIDRAIARATTDCT